MALFRPLIAWLDLVLTSFRNWVRQLDRNSLGAGWAGFFLAACAYRTSSGQKNCREEMKAFFAGPERIAEHLKEAEKNLSEKETLLIAHQKEIQKVREEMTRTHQLYLDGQGFGEFYKPAEERLNQLTAMLPKLQTKVDLLKVNKPSADDILHEATTLYDRWPSLPFKDKRKIIESLIEKIVTGDNEIDIIFSYLPSSEEVCKNQQRLKAG
jgi:site-specific DNA recombinase